MYIPMLTAKSVITERYLQMKSALILLVILTIVLIAGSILFKHFSSCMQLKRYQQRIHNRILTIMRIAAVLVAACTVVCFIRYCSVGNRLKKGEFDETVPSTDITEITEESTSAESTETHLPTQTETIPDPTFIPTHGESGNPENWDIKWEISAGGNIVDSYQAEQPISFGAPEDYFKLPGIATFRGNNFRTGSAYGTVHVAENTLAKIWSKNVGTLNGWPGCGWTGQPLMVQWDAETKMIMNLFPAKKDKENLVEVIYATLDGNIYFYDLDDGSYTRDPVYVGMNFKGAGALDPRGYPIMYVGSGDFLNGKACRMYIISLIDGKILYESKGNESFAFRGWNAFDSSPLVDAETDTLIWPCEDGVLYTIKLNTQYNKAAGELDIEPEQVVMTRYSTNRSNQSTYWRGYEPSAVIVDRYLYISENGGMFFCVDLDTMELVWAQDTKDDSNSTPVFEWNGTDGGFIYTAPSLHWTSSNSKGSISIYKLDAVTGDIVWEKEYKCNTESGVSGGVQATPILGRPGTQLEGLIVYPIARTPGYWDGILVALDTATGEVVWEKSMNYYAWSSPVAVYDESGNAYILIGDSEGTMFLLDHTGKTLSYLELGSTIEASPAIFNNTLVVGTRGGTVYGIKIK